MLRCKKKKPRRELNDDDALRTRRARLRWRTRSRSICSSICSTPCFTLDEIKVNYDRDDHHMLSRESFQFSLSSYSAIKFFWGGPDPALCAVCLYDNGQTGRFNIWFFFSLPPFLLWVVRGFSLGLLRKHTLRLRFHEREKFSLKRKKVLTPEKSFFFNDLREVVNKILCLLVEKKCGPELMQFHSARQERWRCKKKEGVIVQWWWIMRAGIELRLYYSRNNRRHKEWCVIM